MKHRRISTRIAAAAALGAGLAAALPATAAPVFWTDWTAATVGNPGSAQGTIAVAGTGSVGVSYSGQVLGQTNTNNASGGVSWTPAGTFSGGNVDNAPPFRDIVALSGGPNTGTYRLTFSTPITDPVMALWSVGAGTQVTYVFGDEPFTLQSGGPSAEFSGVSIEQLPGNVIAGSEANGVIQFSGTFSALDWTVPTAEFYHGFTVGVAGVGSGEPPPPPPPPPPPGGQVPLPSTLGLLAAAGLGASLVRQRRR